MNLDLRIPMGLMFSFVGIILAAYGAATNSMPVIYDKSLGINVNLWWGIILLIFGQIMFHMGRRTQKRLEKLPPLPPSTDPTPRRGH
jgi:hypothetical protein